MRKLSPTQAELCKPCFSSNHLPEKQTIWKGLGLFLHGLQSALNPHFLPLFHAVFSQHSRRQE